MENFRVIVFRAVAEQASFRKASEHLHLSQPAVSQHIRALEEELGVRLFDRSGNRVQLTDSGRLLLEYARKSAKLAQKIREAIAAVNGDSGGELRIGASTTVAQYVLPTMLGAFQKLHPNIRLSVVSGNTEDIVDRLTDETIELAMIEGPPLKKDIHVESFLDDSMILIAPATADWLGSSVISLRDIASLPLLLREHGSGSRRVVEQALQAEGLTLGELRIAMELDSTSAIVGTVEAGLGVGFVSTWAVRKELLLGTVVHIHVEGLDIRRKFTLARPLGPAPTGTLGIFWRFALEVEGLRASASSRVITKTNRR